MLCESRIVSKTKTKHVKITNEKFSSFTITKNNIDCCLYKDIIT